MRVGRNSGFIRDEEGKLLGICLGSDYCAEHEWGIKDLKRAFGIKEYDKTDTKHAGIERRIVSQVPGNFQLLSGKNWSFLQWPASSWGEEPKTYKQVQDRYGLYSYKETLVTAWSDRDFGILASEKSDQEALAEIDKHFRDGNIAMFLGGGGPFKNAGLVFAIADRIPSKFTDDMKQGDLDSAELNKTANATGIYELLKKAGKGYYALSPKILKDGLHFWLNPSEQDKNNSGWFTVDELKAWARGEGPIPKTEKK